MLDQKYKPFNFYLIPSIYNVPHDEEEEFLIINLTTIPSLKSTFQASRTNICVLVLTIVIWTIEELQTKNLKRDNHLSFRYTKKKIA